MERTGYFKTVMDDEATIFCSPDEFDSEHLLISLHMPVVEKLCRETWKKAGRSIAREDLLSVGVYGLCQALQSYELETDVDFEQHCIGCIERALTDAIRYADFVRRYESEPREFVYCSSEYEMERDHGAKEYTVIPV